MCAYASVSSTAASLVVSLPLPAAGNAFCQAAQLHLQLQNKHDAATSFVDAGNAFKKADPQGKSRGGSCTLPSKAVMDWSVCPSILNPGIWDVEETVLHN